MSYSRSLLAILVVGLAAWLARGQDDADEVRKQQLDARQQQYVQLCSRPCGKSWISSGRSAI